MVFEKILNEGNVSTTEVIAHNNNREIFLKDHQFALHSAEELTELINSLIEETSTGSIFVKPLDGIGGSNSYKFTSSQKLTPKIKELFNLFTKQNFIFQETIQQHEDINKIYSKSINTVRVHTYRNPNTNDIELISALMRFGLNNNEMDNVTSGGFLYP